jgi:hypothetical protein
MNNEWGNHRDYDIYFWYTVEETRKGIQVSEIWHDIGEIPQQETVLFIQNLADEVAHSYYFSQVHHRLFSQLFNTSWLTDEQLQVFLDSMLFIENPETVISFLRSSQTAYFTEKLNLPQIWSNIDTPLDDIHEVTKRLLGKEHYETLRNDREKKEQARKETEKVRQIAELQRLTKQYRLNPSGIRNDLQMRNICLQCGSQNAASRSYTEYYFRVCQDCGNEWYVNDCWNCDSGHVDSRDPETPQCPNCRWYKCQICGACRQGCTTSP